MPSSMRSRMMNGPSQQRSIKQKPPKNFREYLVRLVSNLPSTLRYMWLRGGNYLWYFSIGKSIHPRPDLTPQPSCSCTSLSSS